MRSISGILAASAFALIYVAPALFAAPALAETSPTPPDSGAVAERRRDAAGALARTLNETVSLHGADSVALQASLLVAALTNGALRPTEVQVVGPSPGQGEEYLRIRVDTGMVFDSDTTSDAQRIDAMWREIASPALSRLGSTDFKPGGIDLVIAYGMQSYRSNHRDEADLNKEFERGQAQFVISADTLRKLVAGELAIEDLKSRTSPLSGKN